MPRFAALGAVIGAVVLAGTAFVVLHDWGGMGPASFDFAINSVVYDSVVVGAGLACLLRAARGGPERNAWLLIAASVLAWAAAEVYWTARIEGNASAPYPSPADAGYLAF